jgi:hypothetical protein
MFEKIKTTSDSSFPIWEASGSHPLLGDIGFLETGLGKVRIYMVKTGGREKRLEKP